MFELRTLGTIDLRDADGARVGALLDSPKRFAILVYLLLARPPGPQRRDTVLALFWPESDRKRARGALRSMLHLLRRDLGRDVLVAHGQDSLAIAPDRLECDAVEFERALERGGRREALELYRGDFLEGFFVPAASPELDQWFDTTRQRLRRSAAEAAWAVAEEERAEGDATAATRWGRRAVALSPLGEAPVRRLMELLDALGDRAGALRAYAEFEERLRAEMEISPSARTVALADRLRRQEGGLVETGRSTPDRSEEVAVERETSSGSADTERAGADRRGAGGAGRTRDRPAVAGALRIAPVVGGLLIAAAALWATMSVGPGPSARGDALDRLRMRALVEVPRLAEAGRYEEAYALAREASAAVDADTLLDDLWHRFSSPVTLETEPAGARVYRRPYTDPSAEWEYLGTTPLREVRLPRGHSRFRLELDGHRTVEAAFTVADFFALPRIPLPRAGAPAPEMVSVPGDTVSLTSHGLEHVPALRLGPYRLDRFEVTNREYQRFVDAGGYASPEYWEHPFVRDGRTLSFEEAVRLFTDRTGRPGPSTWEAGTYPPGRGDHPVAGVSWYEAAAYARFAGKALPTVYHWNHAADKWLSPAILPRSNFGGEGTRPVGESDGIARFGNYDMGGNVREWCYNAGVDGDRYILGGGWTDQPYMYFDAFAQSPFDRSAANGIRLAAYPDTTNLDLSRERILRPIRHFREETPVSDRTFRIYRRMYDYDAAPLNARVEAADTTDRWIRERISFDAAYAGERMLAYLYLPRTERPPYQTVVYFPGAYAVHERSADAIWTRAFDFLVGSGRALLHPIYQGTYERGGELDTDIPDESVAWREHTIMWAKDLGRSIDYAETRDDLDAERLAFYGFSWGARMGGLLPAVEPRIDVAVLTGGGLKFQRALPEADPFNFVPRVTVPVLMLNGRYDHFYPLETAQRPMFELLGTPREHKRHVVAEDGHFVPRDQLIRETLDWLDRYLGSVERER
ncbi:MAG: SUMF1/EgtB/PvdO family nonheme iron enzyme [Gemmatimonadota bacterium]